MDFFYFTLLHMLFFCVYSLHVSCNFCPILHPSDIPQCASVCPLIWHLECAIACAVRDDDYPDSGPHTVLILFRRVMEVS